MHNTKKFLRNLCIAVLVLGLSLGFGLLFNGCGSDEETPAESTGAAGSATYTIEVKTASGVPLKEVSMFIYEDSTLAEMEAVLKTDEEGKTSFTATVRDTYVAVLDKVPTGYTAEEYYPITGTHTEIILEVGSMEDVDVSTLTYKLGDPMMDFSVTTPEGKTLTLSELFQGKKAVVLNFFYNNCQPCMMEFPHLQEAYAQYSDSIAVLAMNPVDGDDASVAALKKEMGITFPMVKCDAQWGSIMQLSAYPTTVVIDRFGNICLIHTGSIDKVKTFTDVFAYFTADDYEQKLITDITDLLTAEEEGSEGNPKEVGSQTEFEVTVKPGQLYYCNLYRVFNMYLSIQSDKAYVVYNGTKYEPKNGSVGLMVSAPDTFNPAQIAIGNSGTEEMTFKATLSALKGSFDNPYSLTLGELDVSVAAGQEQGVYYTYTPAEDGTMTMKCLSVTSGVKYSYFLFNTVTGAQRNLESDGNTDENGNATVTVQAKKGQLIQICISTLPDSNNNYPAASFKFEASFEAGEVKEEEKIETTDYTVTVVDQDGTPLGNVSVMVLVGEEQTAFSTDQEGNAKFALIPGTYTGQIYIPDGYVLEDAAFTLTEEAPTVVLTLQKIQKADYTVKVLDPAGKPVENVLVRIGSGAWLSTDAYGTLTANLEVGEYTVMIMIPTGYSGETAFAFPEGATELTITLGHAAGSEHNPREVNQYPFSTGSLEPQQTVWYTLNWIDGIQGYQIKSANAFVIYEGVTYRANDGVLKLDVTGTVTVAIGNGGDSAESFTLEGIYPLGTRENPAPLPTANSNLLSLSAGDADGYYYYGVAQTNGDISIRLLQSPSAPYDVVIYATNRKAMMTESSVSRNVTLRVAAGETYLIQMFAYANETTGEYPAMNFRFRPTFTETEEAPDIPDTPVDPDVPDTTDPTDPQGQYTYAVTLTDAFGAGQKNVGVMFMKDGAPVSVVYTDKNGLAQMHTDDLATYTIELVFTDKEYYYDKESAVVTAENKSLTIKLIANVDEENNVPLYILNDNPAYVLETGGTRVQVGMGKPNFSAEYESNCFFVFTPQTAGTYQISLSTNVELSFWGVSTFINKYTDKVEDNVITFSISESSVKHTTYVIGIKADTEVADIVVNIARIGDPEFSISDTPWTEWQTGIAPNANWKSQVGLVDQNGAYYTLSKTPTYMDITAADGTYNLVYDEADGYYRLGENGPIVLVDLNVKKFVPLYERVFGNGQYGGSAVTRYFYDETGKFVKREEYDKYLAQCFEEVNLNSISETGYYPLTKDMMYVLQNGFCQWWDSTSPNYMEGFATANPNYAWMFAVCYVAP